jgi:2,3-bisphosphoglycerate-independent phosphoglycerate mutase
MPPTPGPTPSATPAAAARNTPLVLIIRDGWGHNPHAAHDPFNAVKLARTPVADMLDRDWPRTLIKTSGEDVGLPEGTMGNSEVGHQNIGAGRIVDQESVRITKACRDARLKDIPALVDPIVRSRDDGRLVHLMGICSDAGVHGLLEHLYAMVALCRELRVPRVAIHLFTDGRDTGPFTGAGFVRQVQVECERLADEGFEPRIASIIGRYWSMDRDNRWERVERAYECLTGRFDQNKGLRPHVAPRAEEAVRAYYQHPANDNFKGDEFITPTMIGEDLQDALSMRIRDGDCVIFYNYRGDRPRELVSAFVLPEFDGSPAVKPSPDSGRRGFDRGPKLEIEMVTLTAYSEALAPHVHVAFPKPPKMNNIGGEYIASLGLTQFRCAETEKYPHVTFFFNDYRDAPFPGESRENPQSPKVSTYDQKPEMAAHEVRDAVLHRLRAPDCESLIVVNFANGDMVGHTGSLDATVQSIETVDACVGAIVEATLERGGTLIITADHGNAEQMFDPATGSPHTAHTIYDVPLYIVGHPFKRRQLRSGGRLADIFPTALAMMGLPQPEAMTGESLLM